MDRQLLQAEIDAKKLLLEEFDESSPSDGAYWRAWAMAENIAKKRRKAKRPKCRAHVENLIRENIQWLERRLVKPASQ